ncbi:MAG: aminotransferase [Halioglobus sp.]|jgi:putrescine aminotransferase|nr:aminotransferase, class III superfamily [marine gamma proteobacterium HTCC2148]MBT3412370.1 aminotransferase [Halieaceae bacterium]MDG1388583.1 aminotransferase [Halioglobus sp.]MBT5005433.1 aminotransferase [Halieaceae bacterium]MBT6125903.1 aminotransferase [Halieaceae bacterium]
MSIRESYNKVSLHPWADLSALGEDEETPIVTRGDGVYLYDDQGRKMIDGPAGMWCMQTGYGRQEIADAVSNQIMTLGFASAFNVVNEREVELARRIADKTPGDLNRVFFTTGGSTAVDSALRLCQLANNIKGLPNKKHILTRDKAYHGSTFLAASVTGKERDKTAMDVLKENVHFLSAPCFYTNGKGRTEQAFCDDLVSELERKILDVGPENIMCYIAEPVLGSGGVIVPPDGYNRRCWEVVKKHGIVYIADEVVTAFGRLGHWFASEAVFAVVPDIITFAKGVTSGYLPLGGYAVSDAFMAEISGDKSGGNCYSNGYTWSANPVSCAAAIASWDIIEQEGLLDHVRDVGPYFQAQLRTLQDHPLVGVVRGTGLMAAVEMRVDNCATGDDLLAQDYALGEMVDNFCHDLGLLVRPLINVCIMSPPLIITREQIDDLVGALRQALDLTQAALRKAG